MIKDNKWLSTTLLVLGVICLLIWGITTYVITEWLATFYVNMLGAVGFLCIAFYFLSRADKKLADEKKDE